MRIAGCEPLQWARKATTFVAAGAPLFLGDEVLDDGRVFLVRRGDDVALGVEVERVMSGTPLARGAARGALSIKAEVQDQGGLDVIVAAQLVARSPATVWIEGSFSEDLTTEERAWRARTALAAIAGDAGYPLPMPDRPIGSGEPIEIDLLGDVGGIGNRARDLAFIRDSDASIILNIDSDGGNLDEAKKIYALLVQHPRAVFVNIAKAFSAASLIALAGDVRSIAADGQMLVHPPSFSSLERVTAEELKAHVKRLTVASEYIADVVAARTGQSVELAASWLANETYFDAGEAIDAGLAHRVAFDQAPITPQAVRAKFAPIAGPYRGRRPVAAPAPLYEYGAYYDAGQRVRHEGRVFVARRHCFGAPGLEPDRNSAWRSA